MWFWRGGFWYGGGPRSTNQLRSLAEIAWLGGSADNEYHLAEIKHAMDRHRPFRAGAITHIEPICAHGMNVSIVGGIKHSNVPYDINKY